MTSIIGTFEFSKLGFLAFTFLAGGIPGAIRVLKVHRKQKKGQAKSYKPKKEKKRKQTRAHIYLTAQRTHQ